MVSSDTLLPVAIPINFGVVYKLPVAKPVGCPVNIRVISDVQPVQPVLEDSTDLETDSCGYENTDEENADYDDEWF